MTDRSKLQADFDDICLQDSIPEKELQSFGSMIAHLLHVVKNHQRIDNFEIGILKPRMNADLRLHQVIPLF